MGNEILVDNPDEIDSDLSFRGDPGQALVSWLIGTVRPWRDHRNRLPEVRRWAEYWRMWRGFWHEEDRNKQSERSKLIGPALATAVEMSVAEVEEALLSREIWIDVADDVNDQDAADTLIMRDLLLEDMETVKTKDAIAEAVTNSAIFGTGIVKMNVDVIREVVPQRNVQGRMEGKGEQRVVVSHESIRPDMCIPDPSGTTVKEMMGFAIDYRNKPVHAVLEKVQQGAYRSEALPFIKAITNPKKGDEADHHMSPIINDTDADAMHLLEYHGKVPLFLLEEAIGSDALGADSLLRNDFLADGELGPLVEAIVVIGNESVLLKAIKNPFVKVDRSIIAFPWEKVPGHFWGRGVMEKGYNPQKAFDAEMRGRIDSLGFVSAPMVGMDAGRVPRGFRPEVKPGKVWLTNGNPNEVIQPVSIGQVEPNTFSHTSELIQMVQLGTGALDTSSTLRGSTGSGGNAATSGSMMLGAFVKRSKRAVQNVERQLIVPLVQGTAIRYLQFAPSRYPFSDFKFSVKGGLGIIAREIEQVNLTQLIAMLPDDAVGAKLAAAEGFIEMSSAVNKAEILQALQADRERLSQQQTTQAQQQEQIAELDARIRQLDIETLTVDNQKTLAEIRELLARAEVQERKADDQDRRTDIETGKLAVQVAEIENFDRQNDIAERRLDLTERSLEQRERNN